MKRVIEGKLFYSRNGLIKSIGIAPSTIGDWAIAKIECEDQIYYHYNAIPEPSRKRIDEYEHDWRLANLLEAYENGYVKHIPACSSKSPREDIYRKAARNMALWERILAFTDQANPEKVTVVCMHETYLKLGLKNQRFTNYHAFYKKLKECRSLIEEGKSLAHAFVSGLTGNKHAEVLTPEHKRLIELYWADTRKLKRVRITEEVNKALQKQGLEPISYSSVKKHLRNPEVQNRNYILRYGSNAYDNKIT